MATPGSPVSRDRGPNATWGAPSLAHWVPIVAAVEHRLAEGDFGRAVREAYFRVVLDAQRAYSLRLPGQWTHREFLAKYLRPDMGILPTLVAELHRLYEPVRFGTESDWVKGDVRKLLEQIYSEPPMRNLYRNPPAEPAPAAPTVPTPGRAPPTEVRPSAPSPSRGVR
jgi:hypothetical protein